ncbi:HAD family phosphatase [Ruminococcus sp.]|uniref:HAD family hydrolase n=1 Tax=Ruminococcus sp. TaxID=41978 RepID=UPI0025CCE97A|nr:HAD family phosphatase [Ruminococcus sp.]MBQ8966703.1 HAD family phosphatase [Ruminococcus sp.]
MRVTDFKAAIFDLDGTLIRSNGVWSEIDRKFMGKRGLEVPADYYKAVSTKNFRTAAVYTKELFDLPDSVEDIMQEWQDMAVYEYTYLIGEVEGAGDYLRYLHGKGLKLGLATANSAALYAPVLKRLGVYELFDTFVTTEQVERGKGFPDVYELACENLGAAPENSIVFEDIIEGIRGAKLGGFKAAACLNEHYSADKEALIAESDMHFESYRELM